MNIEAFLLCDAATDSNGKLNVLGAFDSLYASALPTSIPHCAVALRLRMGRSEQGDHLIKLQLVDEDGKNVIQPIEGNFRIGNLPGTSGCSNLILNLQGLRLTRFGEVAINLFLDGREVATLPLFVRQTGAAMQT